MKIKLSYYLLTRCFSILLLSTAFCVGQGGLKEFSNTKSSQNSINSHPLSEKELQHGSIDLSKEQDELIADVQELIEDQTNSNVIKLFAEVEELMVDVTDNLEETNTNNETIFTENLIIEKIFEAAKEKSKSSGG